MKTKRLALSAIATILLGGFALLRMERNASAATQAAPDTVPPAISTPMTNGDINHHGDHIITWSATDDGAGLAEIEVQRADNGSSSFVTVATLAGTATSWQQLPKVGQGTYLYRVIAKDGAGNIATSPNSATVIVDTTPSVVTSFTIVPNPALPGAHTLTWSIVEAGGGSILQIDVRRSDSGGGFATKAKLTTPVMSWQQLPAVPPGTYAYQIRVYDTAYNQGWSSVATITVGSPSTPDTTVPSVPAGLTASVLPTSSVTLSWTASTDGIGVAGYKIERATGTGGFGEIASTTSLSFTDSGLAPGTSYSYRIRAYDAAGNLSGFSMVVNVATPPAAGPTAPLAIATDSLPVGTSGLAYAHLFEATGGSQPYMWSIVSGPLPDGLIFSPTSGLLRGIPAAGILNITVQATDSSGAQAQKSFQLFVSPIDSKLFITSLYPVTGGIVQLATIVAGTPFSTRFSATGSTQWSVTSGSLPPGLGMDAATGRLSGTPTRSGEYLFVVAAVDGIGGTTYQATRLTVVSPAGQTLGVLTETLPPSSPHAAYSFTLIAAGGTAPYQWAILSGMLPPGLTLDPVTGEIFGSCPSFGSWPVILQVIDSGSPLQVATRTFSIDMGDALVAPSNEGGGGGGGSCGCVGLEALLLLLVLGLRRR